MNLLTLPIEILEQILALPSGWNNSPTSRAQLRTRLVCKLFNNIISREAFLRLDHDTLVRFPRPKRCTLAWLLSQKSLIDISYFAGGEYAAYVQNEHPRILRYSSLLALTYRGERAVCKRLKTPHIDLMRRWHYRCPLSLAAYCGDEDEVALLLSEGTDVNAPDKWFGPPIFAAACSRRRAQRIPITRSLLEHGADPNVCGYDATLLMLARRWDDDSLLSLLLDCDKIDPNMVDGSGCTALWRACTDGDLHTVRLLLDHSLTDPNLRSGPHSQTPLTAAVLGKHEAIIRLLVERNDIVLRRKASVNCPLIYAAQHGHTDLVQFLLTKMKVNPSNYGIDAKFDTLLCCAAMYGHTDTVKFLLACDNIDPNRRGRRYNCTPLSEAAEAGHVEVVRLLLQRRDILPNKRHTRRTPLWIAVFQGHKAVVSLLLRYRSVNPNQTGTDDLSPLSLAVKTGQLCIVKMLLKRADIQVNLKDIGCRTAIFLACGKGYEELVRLLLNRSDIVLAIDTVLSRASMGGHAPVVRLLLEHDIATSNSRSPQRVSMSLSKAIRGFHLAAVQTLLEFGADVHLKDEDGQTAVDWAYENQDHIIGRTILEHQALATGLGESTTPRN
ncbi:Ankyrin repeat domain-containing protein 60 [Myotisia sp. PD_48]|nr:Ankyrin repeat domain-containing protein 60 [Myotisia sp. PD_48]